MKTWLTRVGMVLMIFAFVVLFLFIIIPAVLPSFSDAPFIQNMFQTLFCKSGETLNDQHDTFNPRPGETDTTVSLSCVNNEGQVRDVGSAPVAVGMIGYLVPFLGGLVIWSIGNNKKKQSVDSWTSSVHILNPTGAHRYENGAEPMEYRATSLSARLEELKTAFDSGLITQAEYDAKRKDLIDEV